MKMMTVVKLNRQDGCVHRGLETRGWQSCIISSWSSKPSNLMLQAKSRLAKHKAVVMTNTGLLPYIPTLSQPLSLNNISTYSLYMARVMNLTIQV